MFDDPKKNLRQMEQALWDAELEALLAETPQEEEEDWLLEAKSFLDQLEEKDGPMTAAPRKPEAKRPQPPAREPEPVRKPKTEKPPRAEKAARAAKEPPCPRNEAVNFNRAIFDDEFIDDDAAVFVTKPRKKGVGFLAVIALLELIAIAALGLWWMQWLI